MPADLPVLELEAGSLLVGDLHLDVSPQGGDHAAFGRWLDGLAGVPRLVVLGDLFDAWVGPAHLALAPARAVVEALRGLVARGTAVDVIVGNRDFLLEHRFEAESGARVHPRGLLARLPGGRRVLVVHGDELCTLDLGYQRLKRVLRSTGFVWAATRLPRPVALGLARRLRASSRRAVAAKPALAKQQQEAAVLEWTRRSEASGLVCGHAHAFRAERLGPDGPDWWVLDAWGGTRDLLRVEPAGSAQGPFGVLSSSRAAAPA